MKDWIDVMKYLADSGLTATEAFIAVEKAAEAKRERNERFKREQERHAVQMDLFAEKS